MFNFVVTLIAFTLISGLVAYENQTKTPQSDNKDKDDKEDTSAQVYSSQYYDQTNPFRA